MKVLITGGSGFIGRAIAERLRASGYSATAVSLRTPPGPAVFAGCGAVVHLAGEPGPELRVSRQVLVDELDRDQGVGPGVRRGAEVDGRHSTGPEPTDDSISIDHSRVGAEQRVHVRQIHPDSLARRFADCKDSSLLFDGLVKRHVRRGHDLEVRRNHRAKIALHRRGLAIRVDKDEPAGLVERPVRGIGGGQVAEILVIGAAGLDPAVGPAGGHREEHGEIGLREQSVEPAGPLLAAGGARGVRPDAGVLAPGVAVHHRDVTTLPRPGQRPGDRQPSQHRLDEQHAADAEQRLRVAPAEKLGEPAEPAPAAGVLPVVGGPAARRQPGGEEPGLGGLARTVDADDGDDSTCGRDGGHGPTVATARHALRQRAASSPTD